LGLGLFSILQEKSNAAMFRFVLAAVLLVLRLMQSGGCQKVALWRQVTLPHGLDQ
jgi:hypothetical protein